jgi:hypothetical protein
VQLKKANIYHLIIGERKIQLQKFEVAKLHSELPQLSVMAMDLPQKSHFCF